MLFLAFAHETYKLQTHFNLWSQRFSDYSEAKEGHTKVQI